MRTVISLLIVLCFVSILNPTTSDAEDSAVWMYWADFVANKIQRANLDGTNVQDHIRGFGRPTGVALDIAGGKMYWTDRDKTNETDPIGRSSIQGANLDGTNVEILVLGGNSVKEYIVLDISNGKMYWSEWTHPAIGEDGRIRRANLDGSNVEDLVTGLSWGVRGIALDISQGKMYWGDRNKIQRANLDGSNIQDVLTGEGTHGIALDVSGGKLYWAAAGKIRRANLDGSNVEDLVDNLRHPFGIALDSLNGMIYWTDPAVAPAEGKIQRFNLDSANVENVVTGLKAPVGIALSIPQTTGGHRPSIDVPTTLTATRVRLSPSPVASPAVGEQLTLDLNITGGENVTGYQATLQFDATALRYVESSNADYLPAGAFAIPAAVEGNTITLAATSLAGESNGDGRLAAITFEVVAVKASSVTLSNVLLTDNAGGSSIPRIADAQITESTHLPADVNRDGIVNIIDLTLVASNFGKQGTNAADVNGDGIVNIIDLTLVAAAFGNTAAAPFVWNRDSELAPTRAAVDAWLREARKLNLTDPTFQRGLVVLEQLLAMLTPKETVLLPNYPNPFNPETWIPYQLAKSAPVAVSIHSADGTLVRTLRLGEQSAGRYHSKGRAAYWDGRNQLGERVANGLYFYTLTAGDFTETRKLLIRK